MTLGTDFILNALLQEGLTHLFMVPGGLVDPFLPALARHNTSSSNRRDLEILPDLGGSSR